MRPEESRTRIRRSRGGVPVTILLCFISATLLISLFFFLFSFFYGTHVLKESAPPPLLGNKPETVALLEKQKDDIHPFTFWVAGDSHRGDYLRILYPEQVKPQHPSFGIILGDVVIHPLREQQQYFWYMCRRWGIDSPTLMVIGNHDVAEADWTGVPDWAPNPFFMKQFEDAYGPADLSFKYAGCLFIIFKDVLEGDVHVGFLKEVLAKEASDARMIFVFCHIPPRTENAVTWYNAVYIPELADLVKKYHIDFVISGHFHTYMRTMDSGATYLISGGGTGLAGRESALLSHGIFLNVDPASGTVTERVMVVDDGIARNALFHVLRFAVLDVTPFIKSFPLIGLGLYAVNLLLSFWALIRTVRRFRRTEDRR